MRSPPASPPRSTARGASADREREGGSAVYSAHNRLSSLSTVPELERPCSRSSVNFSRPISPTLTPENRPMSLSGTAVREVPAAEVVGVQQSISRMSEKPVNTRPKTHAAETAENGNAVNSAGPVIGTAVAAAQAVSAQKGSPRVEPAHARAERVDPGFSANGTQGHHADNALPVAVSRPEPEHPSSRAIPQRWPSTVIEENGPEDGVGLDTSYVQEPGHRLASASPTVDHVEVLSTPQPSPKADKAYSPQQQTNLRQPSSPGRSARFARWLSVSATGDQVHQPPPRSFSPVKSALKNPRENSSSPDRKLGLAGRGMQPPSEISDGTSVASDEGSRIGGKKRSVKVSFDDEAEIVGVAASPPTSPEEYVPESPPSKSRSRMSWFGVGRKKPASDFMTGDDDFDEVMKPRPALPSFGSVRGNREGGLPRPPIPEFSDNESTSSSNDEVPTHGVSFSNDHALGVVSSVQHKEPSQVHDFKSVEQLSDNGQPSSPHQNPSNLEMDGVAVGGLTERQPFSGVDSSSTVPTIAVEPATPSLENERPSFDNQRSSLEQYTIPGGFPPSNSDRNLKGKADGTNAQPVTSAAPKLDDADLEGESDGSVYSDAAEDFDGDGFLSINAIVDSRSTPMSTAPLGTSSGSRDTTPKPVDRTAVVDSQSRDVTDQVFEDVRSVTPTQDSVNRQMEESPTPSPTYVGFWPSSPPLPIKSKSRPSQNGTIQAEQARQTRSMSADAHGASSLQDPRHSGNANGLAAGKGKVRPVSLGPAFQMKAASTGFPTSRRRTTSNGSDSSSSFKRSSPSARGDGPHAMRRTMRASPTFLAQSPSDRAESPAEHRPLSSGSGTGAMRKTLRGPSAGGERYSFFSTDKKAQPSRARFAKAPPKSMRTSRFAASDDEDDEARPRVFRSRFADSSDEDEPGNDALRPVRGIPRRQGAHDGDSTDLEDSSEEDRRQRPQAVVAPPVNLAPPGSRDKNAPPKMSGMAAVARQRGMTQRELEEFLMQPPRGRKPGLLTRLGIKKPKNSEHRIRKADVESPSRRDTPMERSRLEREHLRGEAYVNGNRGTTAATVSAAQAEPSSSSKLLKKNAKRHTIFGGESWPLRPAAEEEPREPVGGQNHSSPSSPLRTEKPAPPMDNAGRDGSIVINGGGSPAAVKEPGSSPSPGPDFNDASSDITNTTNHEHQGPSARDVVIAGSGRKRRFPLLRKAFGLRA